MQIVNYDQYVRMFLDASELYGLATMFESTFDGRLLHDVEAGNFVWLTDDEFDELQFQVQDAADDLIHGTITAPAPINSVIRQRSTANVLQTDCA